MGNTKSTRRRRQMEEMMAEGAACATYETTECDDDDDDVVYVISSDDDESSEYDTSSDDDNDELDGTEQVSEGNTYYTFHSRCGKHVKLRKSATSAKRKSARNTFNHGVVLTEQHLKRNERLEIRIDKMVDKWSGSIEIGVTSLSPEHITFPATMTDSIGGSTLMWSGNSVVNMALERDLDDCTAGDTIGIMISDDGLLNFYYNGDELSDSINLKEVGFKNIDHLYGAVDIYGRCQEISICEKDFVEEMASIGDFDLHASLRREYENDQDGTMQQMRMLVLVLKDFATMNIHLACQLVGVYMLKPYAVCTQPVRRAFGDHLANLGAVKQLKVLLDTLMGVDQPTENDWIAIKTVRSTCWNYSDASLRFCRHIGQCGLLEDMLNNLQKYLTSYNVDENLNHLVLSAIAILHNCSKTADNKNIYSELDAVTKIVPYITSDDLQIASISILTLSYIIRPGEESYLDASETIVRFLLQHLSGSLDEPNLRHGGFTSLELVVGLGNLALNNHSKITITTNGAVPLLLKLMEKELPLEQECAINTLWVLSKLKSNRKNILKTPDVIPVLSKMTKHANIAVMQAAERALLVIKPTLYSQAIAPTHSTGHGCEYRALCKRFKESISLPDAYFEDTHDMCYCNTCLMGRGDELYYLRGDPPKYYGLPIGWCRFALQVPGRAHALQIFRKWHVAFHGTVVGAVEPILECGDLLLPGDTRMGGKRLGEREGHFTEDNKPVDFDTRQIFLSPSIRYSGCDVYAYPTEFSDKVTHKKYKARVAFQVRVNPISYKVGPETIDAKSEIDPKFNNQELEWFTKQRGSIIICGLLVNLE